MRLPEHLAGRTYASLNRKEAKVVHDLMSAEKDQRRARGEDAYQQTRVLHTPVPSSSPAFDPLTIADAWS